MSKVFSKTRDRVLTTDMTRKSLPRIQSGVMAAMLAHHEVAPLFSDEHFLVDRTLSALDPRRQGVSRILPIRKKLFGILPKSWMSQGAWHEA